MPQFISPETRIVEVHKGPAQLPTGGSDATILLVGLTEKGPINEAVRVTNASEARNIFGNFIDDMELMYWLDFYLTQTGGRGEVYIRRITHYTDITDADTSTAAKASATLTDEGPGYVISGTDPAIVTSATSKTLKVLLSGNAGDSITLAEGLSSGAAIAAAIQAAVRDLSETPTAPAVAGDYTGFICKFTRDERYVLFNGSIGVSKTVTVEAGASNDVAVALKLTSGAGAVDEAAPPESILVEAIYEGEDGNLVSTTLEHTSTLKTTLAADLVNGDKQITVTNASGMTVGMLLEITDNTATVEDPFVVEVKSINNNVITLQEAVVLSNTVEGTGATPAYVRSLDFKLTVKKAGKVVETYPNLSMNPYNTERYFEPLINEGGFASKYIRVTHLAPPSLPQYSRPSEVTDTYLTGGLDGDTGVTSTDWIGDADARTGIQIARDLVDRLNFVICPGQTSAAFLLGLQELAEELQVFEAYVDLPFGLTKDQAITFWEASGITSDYMHCFWPEFKMADPRDRSKQRSVGASAYHLGLRTRLIDSKLGHKPAAGFKYPARGGVGLGSYEASKKEVRDDLVLARINPIATILGRTGYFAFGEDTATPGGVGSNAVGEIHKRWIILKMKREMTAIVDAYKLSEVVDADLLTNITSTLRKYCRQRRADGWLVGQDEGDAYIVDFGAGLNTYQTMALGQVNGRVGVRLGSTLKHIYIEFGEISPAREEYLA